MKSRGGDVEAGDEDARLLRDDRKGRRDDEDDGADQDATPVDDSSSLTRARGRRGGGRKATADDDHPEPAAGKPADVGVTGETAEGKPTEYDTENEKKPDDTPSSSKSSFFNRTGNALFGRKAASDNKKEAGEATVDDAKGDDQTKKSLTTSRTFGMGSMFRRGGSSESQKLPSDSDVTGDIESGVVVEKLKDKNLFLGPMKVLEPMRTDVVKAIQTRQKRLERLSALNIPEIHYIGQILSGRKIAQDSSEGIICR